MSGLHLTNVPPDLHAALRRRAEEEGLSVSDYVLALIERELALPSQQQWFANLATRDPVAISDILPALDEVRESRERDLLRRL